MHLTAATTPPACMLCRVPSPRTARRHVRQSCAMHNVNILYLIIDVRRRIHGRLDGAHGVPVYVASRGSQSLWFNQLSTTWVALGAGFTVRARGSLSTRCRVLHAVGILQLLCKSLTSSYVTMRGPCSVGLCRGHTRNEIPLHTLRLGANCIVCVSYRFRFWFSCSSAHTTVSPVVCVRDIWLLSSRIKRLSTAL